MMAWLWAAGLVRRRGGRLVGTMLGIAVAVALLATLGGFFAATRATSNNHSTAQFFS